MLSPIGSVRPWLLLGITLLACLGCDRFRQPTTTAPLNLSANRLAPDAVRLEIGIAQLDTSQAATLQQFWQTLDPQELPLKTRQLLDRHGLKAAVMPARPPAGFSKLVKPRQVVLEELDAFQKKLYLGGHLKAEDRMVGHNRIANRRGESYPISVSSPQAEYVWQVYDGDRTEAFSSRQVQGIFSVRTYPRGDGSVRVVVDPQIHHGDLNDRYGATADGFKYERQQTIEILEQIRLDVPLRPGETLVIGPTADLDELGELFFGNGDFDQLALPAVPPQPSASPKTAATVAEELPIEALLPDLGIDESKFEHLVADLDIDSINQSLIESLGIDLKKPQREKPKPLHRLLLIRVVQTQLDDLFDQQLAVEPLTSGSKF